MNELIELIRVATPTKVKNMQTLGKSDSMSDRLYWLLHKGAVTDDEDALIQLYPGKKSKTGLYQVKEKLYSKLLDAILIIDPSDSNSSQYSIVYHNCLKLCAAFEKIALKGGNMAAIKLGEKILKTSLNYNLCFIIVRVSRVLMRKSMYVLNDEVKIEYYRGLYVKYSEIEQLQELARYYWVKIALRTSQKRMVDDKALVDEAQKYIDELESKLVPEHTAITFTLIHGLKIRIEEQNQNYKKVVELIDQYLQIIPRYKSVHSNFYTVMLNKKLAALITLRKFDKARKVAENSLKYTKEGDSTWFTALETIIILHYYQAQYSEALRVYQIAKSNKGLRFLPKNRQEIFKVYRAYFQFFINIGLMSMNDVGENYKVYRAAKFANEVPISSHDKTGTNITIIVAQFLLLFTEGKYQKAINKIESIKQYSRSHLRKDVTFRSNCFLKMLVALVECNYHKEATIRKTKVLFEKLKSNPAEMQRQTSYVEIIPYEVLWEIILNGLDNTLRGKIKRKAKEH